MNRASRSRRPWRRLALGSLCLALVAAPAAAQSSRYDEQPTRYDDRARDRGRSFFSIAGGVGLMDDPDAALFAVDVLFDLGRYVSFGPWLQIGVEDEFTIVSLSGNLRGIVGVTDIAEKPYAWARPLSLFGTIGAGFTHIDLDVRGDVDETEFMLNFGAGLEYALSDRLSIGTSILYNFTPDDVFGEDLIFSWQALTTRYRF